MSDFRVTPGDLHDLAGRLSRLLGELSQVAGSVRSDQSGAAGAPRLEASISEFLADWSAGLEETRAKLDALSQRLNVAGSAYETTETGVMGLFVPR